MATQAGNAVPHPAAAHVVGNAFVNQYYNVLHQSPQVVHRFYTNASRLTRAEAGADGAVDTVFNQNDIHTKVMASDYSELKAQIKTVDSQDSLGGGVLVLVTGSLSTKSNGKRDFVQSFFLAPQEKGYFVLNDIFRYLDEEIQHSKPAPVPVPSSTDGSIEIPAVSQPAAKAVVEEELPAPEPEVVSEVTPPAVEDEATAEEITEHTHTAGPEDDDQIGAVPLEDTTSPLIEEPESPMVNREVPPQVMHDLEPAGEAPKKSYASILRVFETKPRAPAQHAAERTPSAAPSPAVVPTSQDSLVESIPVESEADGRSVYVKNLPMSITAQQLEEEFAKFGPVKVGGVNVKNQKAGVCYAFVEFEDASSAQSAIEASPVPIGGRSVYIEEKKPMGRAPRRTGDRNDRPYRSDRADRGEGGRGRGSYGGRNPGRGPGGQDGRDRDANRGGRGSGASRGGYSNANPAGAPAGSGPDRRPEGQRAPRRNFGGAQLPRSNGPTAVAAV